MVLKCPKCKSEEVTLYMGAHFGKYMCKKCGYVGVLIIEENNKTNKQPNKRITKRNKK